MIKMLVRDASRHGDVRRKRLARLTAPRTA